MRDTALPSRSGAGIRMRSSSRRSPILHPGRRWVRHRFNWKRLSLAGALAYESDASDAHLVFELRPGAYNDEMLIEFLRVLNDIEQRPILLIWDDCPAHRIRRMTDWIQSQRDWLSVEQLHGYAPDLNPLERAWGNLR
jgi:hypothetical protein